MLLVFLYKHLKILNDNENYLLVIKIDEECGRDNFIILVNNKNNFYDSVTLDRPNFY